MPFLLQRLIQRTTESPPLSSDTRHERSYDSQYAGRSRASINQVPFHLEGKLATMENILRLPLRRKTCTGSPRFRLENGEHSHFVRPPLPKVQRFRNDRTASQTSFKTKIKNACTPPMMKLEAEQGMANNTTSITARERKEMPENEEIEDVVKHSSSTDISSSREVQAVRSDIDCIYAVKTFCCGSNPTGKIHRERIITAFDISSSLDHHNIVRNFDLYELSNGDLCESVEHCSGGDLYSLITASRHLEQSEADCFFKQLMHGIHYMHKMEIAHCDLTPENLLLTSHGCLKISNFTNAESFHLGKVEKATLPKKSRYPNPYVPPERYLGSEFDPAAVDIWAAAMIYIAMRTGRIPWKMANDKDECFRDYITDRRIGRGYFFIEDICNIASRRVLYSMLETDYAHRARSTEILCSQWLMDIKTCTAAGQV